MNPIKQFEIQREQRITAQETNGALQGATKQFTEQSIRCQYSYNFSWLGRPIIQYPQDMVAIQEVIWECKPDLIIETGIAHGGSLILSASILQLIGGNGMVLGIDIDIRDHNKKAIEQHPMAKRIKMIQGSSIDEDIVQQVSEYAKDSKKILVILDSNHTHDHVLKELQLYSPFVSKDSYMVVFDTIVEDLPVDATFGRPWGKGDNPKTAVHKFLTENDSFEIDYSIQNKILITVAPDGYLKRIR